MEGGENAHSCRLVQTIRFTPVPCSFRFLPG
jgi:hypothetical protein